MVVVGPVSCSFLSSPASAADSFLWCRRPPPRNRCVARRAIVLRRLPPSPELVLHSIPSTLPLASSWPPLSRLLALVSVSLVLPHLIPTIVPLSFSSTLLSLLSAPPFLRASTARVPTPSSSQSTPSTNSLTDSTVTPAPVSSRYRARYCSIRVSATVMASTASSQSQGSGVGERRRTNGSMCVYMSWVCSSRRLRRLVLRFVWRS
mmetsp:Transcript_45561/g.84415  ORF Transcript_45561/g.84415 Transcript_45561/m.84415 type:complete len:206 (+) Transcript_45561:1744-2361(+)